MFHMKLLNQKVLLVLPSLLTGIGIYHGLLFLPSGKEIWPLIFYNRLLSLYGFQTH